eukprot:1383731-Alexandrium_andersonii.AAC.1
MSKRGISAAIMRAHRGCPGLSRLLSLSLSVSLSRFSALAPALSVTKDGELTRTPGRGRPRSRGANEQ